jgi:hypothetical protein
LPLQGDRQRGSPSILACRIKKFTFNNIHNTRGSRHKCLREKWLNCRELDSRKNRKRTYDGLYDTGKLIYHTALIEKISKYICTIPGPSLLVNFRFNHTFLHTAPGNQSTNSTTWHIQVPHNGAREFKSFAVPVLDLWNGLQTTLMIRS